MLSLAFLFTSVAAGTNDTNKFIFFISKRLSSQNGKILNSDFNLNSFSDPLDGSSSVLEGDDGMYLSNCQTY